MTIKEDKPVNMGLDAVDLDPWETFKLDHFDHIVKLANVSDDGIVLHHIHGFQSDALEVAGRCNKDANLADKLGKRCSLEAPRARLQGTSRVPFRNHDPGSCIFHGSGAVSHHHNRRSLHAYCQSSHQLHT